MKKNCSIIGVYKKKLRKNLTVAALILHRRYKLISVNFLILSCSIIEAFLFLFDKHILSFAVLTRYIPTGRVVREFSARICRLQCNSL
jgi:hypothetical protein